jgi:hypothetical protein
MAKRKALPIDKKQLEGVLAHYGASLPAKQRLNKFNGWTKGRLLLKGDRLDVLQLIGSLHQERVEKAEKYEQKKDQIAERERRKAFAGRDIGEIPAVEDAERRIKAMASFRVFCETYGKGTFSLKWSDDHLKVIEKIERAVRDGELFAVAMPRGMGKTSLIEWASIWAMLTGLRRYVVVLGADEESAGDVMDSIKHELENNELLAADFPEVCYPITMLGQITQRANGQLYRGRPTGIVWKGDRVTLPTIDGSKASGAVIRVKGLGGGIRGRKAKDLDGNTFRPDLVLLDDPQTDSSARSPAQNHSRERVLGSAVRGLAGPGKKIAGLMACTVICEGDMVDRILDNNAHPEWQAERTKLLYEYPTNRELWDEYAKIRDESLRSECGLGPATEFYRKHQKEMDEGSRVAWPERYNSDEISALQHCMNLKLSDPIMFASEYQNEPISESDDAVEILSALEIAGKTNSLDRRLVPLECVKLTAFVDVQQTGLYWVVCAWSDDFSGAVIDYGTEPEQTLDYFTAKDMRRTMGHVYQNAGLEGQIYATLGDWAEKIGGRTWKREDGMEMRIDLALIDANWGKSTDIVYQFCRKSGYSFVMPSHGRYIGASSTQMIEWQKRPGERTGLNWRIPARQGKRFVRHALFDTNYWKSFVHDRLKVLIGDPGCLSLFGKNANTHRMFADHLVAEQPVRVEAKNRVMDEWKLKPFRPDNHYFDGVVGCAVAASILGAALPELRGGASSRGRKRVKLSEIQKGRRRAS